MINIKLLIIKPIHNPKGTCYQDIIASVASYWGRNYELMYTTAWGFSFQSSMNADTIGSRMNAGFVISLEDLAAYHGINISLENYGDSDGVIGAVIEQIKNGMPVGVNTDNYWTPWLNGYQSFHRQHICLIVGVDVPNQLFFCIDPMFSKDVEVVSFQDFRQGNNGKCYFFNKCDDKLSDFNWEKIKQRVYQSFYFSDQDNIQASIRRFAIAVAEEEINILEEVPVSNPSDIWTTPLLANLIQIEKGRYCFSSLLMFISKNLETSALKSIIDEFNQLVLSWENVKSLFLKLYFLKKNDPLMLKSINEKLVHISQEEFRLLENLMELKIVGNKNIMLT